MDDIVEAFKGSITDLATILTGTLKVDFQTLTQRITDEESVPPELIEFFAMVAETTFKLIKLLAAAKKVQNKIKKLIVNFRDLRPNKTIRIFLSNHWMHLTVKVTCCYESSVRKCSLNGEKKLTFTSSHH